MTAPSTTAPRTIGNFAIPASTRSIQYLILKLDGMTAGDYLVWVRDPEPAALGRELRSIGVRAEPLSDRIDLELVWDATPPDPHTAAAAAGFPLTTEVVELRAHRSSRFVHRAERP